MTWSRWARTALLFTVCALFLSAQAQIWGSPEVDWTGGRWLHAVLIAGVTLPLPLVRRVPLAVILVVMVLATAHYSLGGSLGQPWFAMVLAVFALGTHGSQRSSVVGMGAVAVGILSIDLPRLRQGERLDDVLPAWFILAAVWGFGRWMKARRREHSDMVARADAVEKDREQATWAAVAYERSRIARELHDMVAHSLAVIVLQAQAADRVLGTDPAATRRALGSIEMVGRQGLTELRRLLEMLLVTDESADLDPRPSLEHLDLLVDRVREAGLPVEVAVDGDPRPLPPGVDLSAYRIVQEALTNTLKHAGPARATVGLRYRPDALEVQVSDDGAHVQSEDTDQQHLGHGLIGMRERAALFGGTLDAGRQPTGGFQVLARLPFGAEPV